MQHSRARSRFLRVYTHLHSAHTWSLGALVFAKLSRLHDFFCVQSGVREIVRFAYVNAALCTIHRAVHPGRERKGAIVSWNYTLDILAESPECPLPTYISMIHLTGNPSPASKNGFEGFYAL